MIDFLIPHNINHGKIQDYSTKYLVLNALKYCTEFEPFFGFSWNVLRQAAGIEPMFVAFVCCLLYSSNAAQVNCQHVLKKVVGIYLVSRYWLQRFNCMTRDLKQKISAEWSLCINYCSCTRLRMVIIHENFTRCFMIMDVKNSGSLRRK